MIGGFCNWGCVEVMEFSDGMAFGSVWCEIFWVCKCLLKELAMFLLEVWVVLLNFIERLGSIVVGSLMFSELIVLQSSMFSFCQYHYYSKLLKSSIRHRKTFR